VTEAEELVRRSAATSFAVFVHERCAIDARACVTSMFRFDGGDLISLRARQQQAHGGIEMERARSLLNAESAQVQQLADLDTARVTT
jgi:hypothetical protein